MIEQRQQCPPLITSSAFKFRFDRFHLVKQPIKLRNLVLK
jgi:hypothetical protein